MRSIKKLQFPRHVRTSDIFSLSKRLVVPMSALTDIQGPPELPPDLTGKVAYETSEDIAGGYGHVGKGFFITSEKSRITVGTSLAST